MVHHGGNDIEAGGVEEGDVQAGDVQATNISDPKKLTIRKIQITVSSRLPS